MDSFPSLVPCHHVPTAVLSLTGGGKLAVRSVASRGWAATVHRAWREAPTALLWDTGGALRPGPRGRELQEAAEQNSQRGPLSTAGGQWRARMS